MRPLDQLLLNANEDHAIREAAAMLRLRFRARNVILFGSKARGDSQPESDIDLLVLTDSEPDFLLRHEIVAALFPIGLEHGVVFSALVAGKRAWEEGAYRVMPIRAEVDRDGVAA